MADEYARPLGPARTGRLLIGGIALERALRIAVRNGFRMHIVLEVFVQEAGFR
jgi:hypothetical protein